MAKRKEVEKKFVESLQQKKIPDGFIKLTDNPVAGLSSEQKVILNRKANTMFNNGNIEDARRIFITTGYSDGLTRIGEKYQEKNEYIKALRMYLLAHNKRKSDPLLEKFAGLLSELLKED